MTKSKSKEEDAQREKTEPTRMGKIHGGKVVEAISPDDIVSVNDDIFNHELFVRDETEKDFNAFVCSNPACGEVIVYNKN